MLCPVPRTVSSPPGLSGGSVTPSVGQDSGTGLPRYQFGVRNWTAKVSVLTQEPDCQGISLNSGMGLTRCWF